MELFGTIISVLDIESCVDCLVILQLTELLSVREKVSNSDFTVEFFFLEHLLNSDFPLGKLE